MPYRARARCWRHHSSPVPSPREAAPSTAIDATEVVVTTDQFGGAEPLMDETRTRMHARVRPLIERGESPVLTGFIGATVDGVLTTLGPRRIGLLGIDRRRRARC